MVSTVASTSLAPPKVASTHSTKQISSKERKKSGEKGHERSHRSSSKDRQKDKSRRDSTSTSKDDQSSAKDDWKGKKVAGPKESAFRYMYPVVDIPIPPALIQDGHRAANELMDTLLMR